MKGLMVSLYLFEKYKYQYGFRVSFRGKYKYE